MIREFYKAVIDENGNRTNVLDYTQEVEDTQVLRPNYYGLEQALFKSSIFGKYFSYYKNGGLYFQKVVDNGKDGYDVDEFRVIEGLLSMEIPFTDTEKSFINNALTQNGFSVQIP